MNTMHQGKILGLYFLCFGSIFSIAQILPSNSCALVALNAHASEPQAQVTVEPKSAGCLIRSGTKVILVADLWSKRYGLPGGGRPKGESLNETAQRETFEETGIKVKANQVLATLSGGFQVFDCTTVDHKLYLSSTGHPSLPPWAFNEIKELVLIDPAQLELKLWRFSKQKTRVTFLMEQAYDHSTMKVAQSELIRPDTSTFVAPQLLGIRAIQRHSTPYTNALFRFLSALGGETFMMLIIPLIWFGIHPRRGMELALLVITSVLLCSTLKGLCQLVRPFHIAPELKLDPAEGFGFPSGHTLSATIMWLWLVRTFAFQFKRSIALIIIFGVGLSRVYLGVHFFHDVLGGWLIGGLLMALYAWHLERKHEPFIALSIWNPSLLVIGSLAICVRPHPETIAASSFLLGLLGLLNTLDQTSPSPLLELSKSGMGRLTRHINKTVGEFTAKLGTHASYRLISVLIVIVGVGTIDRGISVTAVSGEFFMCLLVVISKYGLLGLWIGLAHKAFYPEFKIS